MGESYKLIQGGRGHRIRGKTYEGLALILGVCGEPFQEPSKKEYQKQPGKEGGVHAVFFLDEDGGGRWENALPEKLPDARKGQGAGDMVGGEVTTCLNGGVKEETIHSGMHVEAFPDKSQNNVGGAVNVTIKGGSYSATVHFSGRAEAKERSSRKKKILHIPLMLH